MTAKIKLQLVQKNLMTTEAEVAEENYPFIDRLEVRN